MVRDSSLILFQHLIRFVSHSPINITYCYCVHSIMVWKVPKSFFSLTPYRMLVSLSHPILQCVSVSFWGLCLYNECGCSVNYTFLHIPITPEDRSRLKSLIILIINRRLPNLLNFHGCGSWTEPRLLYGEFIFSRPVSISRTKKIVKV